MPQHEHAERAEICTCSHLRNEEHVPPFGRCLIEDCGCLEYKAAHLEADDEADEAADAEDRVNEDDENRWTFSNIEN